MPPAVVDDFAGLKEGRSGLGASSEIGVMLRRLCTAICGAPTTKPVSICSAIDQPTIIWHGQGEVGVDHVRSCSAVSAGMSLSCLSFATVDAARLGGSDQLGVDARAAATG